MKKTRLLFLVIMALIALTVTLVACNSGASVVHHHEFGDWNILIQPTCSEYGLRSHRCDLCGEDYAEKIPMKAHTPATISGRAATCLDDGMTDGSVCSVCGAVIKVSEVIPALGHHWIAVADDSVNGHHHICDREGCDVQPSFDDTALEITTVYATCLDAGYTEHSCKVCDFSYRDEIPAIGHEWGEYTQKKVNGKYVHVQIYSHDQTHVKQGDCTIEETIHIVNCEEAGYTEYHCSVCNLSSRENEVEAPGHDFGEDGGWHTITESTCSEYGTEQRECQRTLVDGSKCSHVEKRQLALAEHTYDGWSVTTPSTCTVQGVESRTCRVCRNVETRSAELKPHEYGAWNMETESTCSVAGKDKRTCNDCGAFDERDRALLSHTSQEVEAKSATCLEAGHGAGHECSVCHAVLDGLDVIPALGHKWGKWTHIDGTEEHEHTCENEGCTVGTEREFCEYLSDVVDPRCENVGYTEYTCIDCKNSISGDEQPALGHDYGNWIADIIDEEEGEHVHTHHHVCRRCENIETVNCELEYLTTVKNTCTVAGYSLYTCRDCKVRHEQDIVEAPGHQYETLQASAAFGDRHYKKCTVCDFTSYLSPCTIQYVTYEATCETDGYTVGICNECGRETKRSAIVAKYNHNWTAYEHDDQLSEDGQHTHSSHCTICFTTRTENCKLEEHTKVPTCLSTGESGSVCTVCSVFVGSGNEIEALGHKWGDWQYDAGTDEHYHICEHDASHRESFAHKFTTTTTVANCTQPGQLVETCEDCSYSRITEIPDQPALGHNYKVIFTDSGRHHVVCQNDPTHTDDGAHDFSESNLCSKCSYDGLDYKFSGAHYIVSGIGAATKAKKIIIPAMHKGDGDSSEYPVTRIAASAFVTKYNMEEIVIPYTIESIGTEAFSRCSALRSVIFEKKPDEPNKDSTSLTTIEYHAFYRCTSLTEIVLPDSLTTLKNGVFRSCTNLKNITAGDNLIEIDTECFTDTAFINDPSDWESGMLYLGKHLISVSNSAGEHVEIREDAISISSYAFSSCKTVRKVTIHNGVTTFDSYAFYDCTSLEEVIYKGSLREWLAINFENDSASPLHYAAKLNITEAFGDIVIPEGVTAIPAGTFRGSDITGVTIGPNVTSIGEDAFRDCASLVRVSGAENVTYIGADAFTNSAYYNDRENNWTEGALYIGNCLVAIDNDTVGGEFSIREGVKAIAPYAFKDNMKVTSISIPTGVVYIGEGFISGCGDQLKGITFEDTNYSYLATNDMGILRVVGGGRDFETPELALAMFKLYKKAWRLYSTTPLWQ